MDEINLELAQNSEESTKDKFLTFAVGDEDYGIEIAYVTEIIKVQAITEVPELPAYIKGIINLRGKIIPVMDVRIRFNKEPQVYNDRTCIVVVDIGSTGIGLIVDTVREVMDIDEADITDPSSKRSSYENRFIKGIGQTPVGVKLLLSLDRLVSDN